MGWPWGICGGQFLPGQGPAWNPILLVSFPAVLIWLCSSLEGNQSPEILGPLWENSSWGREVAKKQRRMWLTGKWSSMVRVVTEGTDKAVPSYLAVVMSPYPTWLFPKSQYFPRGLTGTAVTGQALGTKAGRAALGKGLSAVALGVPGRYSTVGREGKCELPSTVTSLPATSFLFPFLLPPASPGSLLPPVSIHLDPCQGGPSSPYFSFVGKSGTS